MLQAGFRPLNVIFDEDEESEEEIDDSKELQVRWATYASVMNCI